MRITPINFSQNLLFTTLKNPMARVLDQARIAGNVEQTVSMLSKATKLDYETVQSALDRLTRLGLAQPTGEVGNARTYKFNLENKLLSRIDLRGQTRHAEGRRG